MKTPEEWAEDERLHGIYRETAREVAREIQEDALGEVHAAALLRLRQICEAPYQAKHGRPLSSDRGWVWEMVQFIHHSISP